MLRIAIVGMGVISHTHLHAIECIDEAELCCICDIDERKKDGYDLPFYTDLDTMLSSEKPSCVHVCLPHHLHEWAVRRCAEHGVNVFLEKPAALNFDEVCSLYHLEQRYSVKIGVCLQNRYNKSVMQLKEIFESGEYGEFLGSKGLLTWARTMPYYISEPWRGDTSRSGGGVMINQAIHTLDLLSHIFGEFDTLEARCANFSLKKLDIEDSVMARLCYKDSDACAIFFSTIAFADNSSVEISAVFEKATFKISDNALYTQKDGGWEPVCQDATFDGEKKYYGTGHLNAITAFYNAIIDGTDDYIHLDDAAYAQKIIQSIIQSGETASPVKIQ